jgi:hypothetical protein
MRYKVGDIDPGDRVIIRCPDTLTKVVARGHGKCQAHEMKKCTNHTPADLAGKTVLRVDHPDDIALLEGAFAEYPDFWSDEALVYVIRTACGHIYALAQNDIGTWSFALKP